jgi:hypothetical protein
MTMMNSKVRKSYRDETARGAAAQEVADKKYAKSISRNAGKLAAYKAGYEAGKAGMSFSDALWKYERTLSLRMSSKENEAFVSGHWAGAHGEEPELDINTEQQTKAALQKTEEENATQEIIETVTETIAELRAATPAERFPDALRTAMKALEMSKGLDDATKSLAYSVYLQALADAVCSPQKEHIKRAKEHKMPRKPKVDKVFQNRTLKDLETLEKWISARLAEFIRCENEAQTLTYRKLKRDVDAAIAEAKAKEASAQ